MLTAGTARIGGSRDPVPRAASRDCAVMILALHGADLTLPHKFRHGFRHTRVLTLGDTSDAG